MTSSVRFTEEMLGHVTFGETDFARGAQPDRDGSAAFKFHLTIEVEDIEPFSHDPLRPADGRRAGSTATRSAANCRSSRAGSTCSSTSSRASSTCSTGSGSTTASATR